MDNDSSSSVEVTYNNSASSSMRHALQRAAQASDRDNSRAERGHHHQHLYRRHSLQQVVDQVLLKRRLSSFHDDLDSRMRANETILEKLQESGVKVFVVSQLQTGASKANLWRAIRKCITEASTLSKECQCYPEWCLLYQDSQGRLFNLLVEGEFSGLASTWESMLTTFSGMEAMAALVILARAFGCANSNTITSIRPGSLTFILGLILVEETSLCWLNAAMLVWGMPSVSAFGLMQVITTDWPRQALLCILVFATIAQDNSNTQRILTLTGVAVACAVLLCNLGARAWRNTGTPPMSYRRPFPVSFAALVSVGTGLLVPYLGFRRVQAGGRAAMESILISALLTAVIFAVSDFDEVQKFFIVGSETCNQDPVNVTVGIWWAISLVASICVGLRIQKFQVEEVLPTEKGSIRQSDRYSLQKESLVEKDHDSPVGYRVPSIPDLRLDPVVASQALLPLPLCMEVSIGLVMAVGIGALLVYSAFTKVDDDVTSTTSS